MRAVRELTRCLVADRPDVVHTHSAKAGAVGRLAARRAGVTWVVHTYHGFPFHEFQRPWTRYAYVAAERALCRRTDRVLAVGSAVAVEAIRRGVASPGQLRTINVAIDSMTLTRTPESRRRARALLGIPDQAPVVGTVGRLDYQKAPETFFAAFAALRHRSAVAVWAGDGLLRRTVEGLLVRLGIADRVLLLGERTDVPAILPAFDVFAMSSRYEGVPCAIVEAMTAGIPVIATAVNAVADVVVPGETGLLVPPQRPTALAAAIDAVLDDPVSAQRRAARASNWLGERFGADGLGAVLDDVYRGRLAEPGSYASVPSAGFSSGNLTWYRAARAAASSRE
jgi:glycosyltransferase involved in cell wall biosynthesis